jgi:titin
VIGALNRADMISSNLGDGVRITGAGSVHNQVADDVIGLTSDGSYPSANARNGVEIDNGASSNTVSGNVIGGNTGTGVWIHDAGTSNNRVRANYIGTNAASAGGLGNSANGVSIGYGASGNTVSGGNVIGDNIGTGVYLFGAGTTGNTVSGNFLGTDKTGTIALGNTLRGVDIRDGANGNTIGGTTSASGNLIAFNGDFGVLVSNANQDAILSNSIYGNGVAPYGFFSGANNNQSAPALTSAVDPGTATTLKGTVANVNTRVFLQVFKDGPNGQVLVFSGWVHSDNSGNFQVSLQGVAAGDVLTATATVGQNSSQFAADITVTA